MESKAKRRGSSGAALLFALGWLAPLALAACGGEEAPPPRPRPVLSMKLTIIRRLAWWFDQTSRIALRELVVPRFRYSLRSRNRHTETIVSNAPTRATLIAKRPSPTRSSIFENIIQASAASPITLPTPPTSPA